MVETSYHVPVLVEPVITGLVQQPGGVYIDATLGGGGHTAALLAAGADHVIGLDQDPNALAAAASHLDPARVTLVATNFADYVPTQPVAGVLADIGVSSAQLDQAERGFSWRSTAPLDMRMNPEAEIDTAADWLNYRSEQNLVKIFSEYGEERFAKRIARQICEKRPLRTTTELADLIWQTVPPAARHGRIHPATRVFQALRIAVNDELGVLDRFLAQAPEWLVPGGHLAVISFHSLEDRRVKWALRQDERLEVITRKPIQATAAEIRVNPRSRSAKLRLAQRLAEAT